MSRFDMFTQYRQQEAEADYQVNGEILRGKIMGLLANGSPVSKSVILRSTSNQNPDSVLMAIDALLESKLIEKVILSRTKSKRNRKIRDPHYRKIDV